MDTSNIPVYNAIKKYLETNPLPFHMPGHKLGRGLPGFFKESLSKLDLTEIPGTDNLHSPRGSIRDAQELAAGAFGADKTFFLVNGSTAGIHAMIAAISRRGDKLIVARDCHRSVIGGMMLAGSRPVYIKPQFNPEFCIPGVMDPGEIYAALEEHPDAVGVVITRPSYYGVCSDIKAISKAVHSFGKILAVDEAHGPHFKFSESLPLNAMDGGADICVQSAHKTLPALTQGAYLHLKSDRVDEERVRFVLGLLQTSSPSYLIMASLDIARQIMQEEGRSGLEALIRQIERLKASLCEVPGLKVLDGSHIAGGDQDPTRLVFNFSRLGRTGFQVEKELREEFGIQAEMSDLFNVVCIATMYDTGSNLERLFSAVKGLALRYGEMALPATGKPFAGIPAGIPEQAAEPANLLDCRRETVVLGRAEGRICGTMLVPYPPGIPLVCPGEIISQEIIEYIYGLISAGGTVNGLGENFEIQVAVI